jgi:tetratricopeptide (TPR) repeat protein
MKTRNTITKLLALALLTSGPACKKKGEDETTTPGETTPEAQAAAAKKKAEAQADFGKAVEVYDKAMADGSIKGDECAKTANAFSKVYKDNGDMMMIAEFNAASIWEQCGDEAKAKQMYEALAAKKFHLAYNNLGVLYWNKGNSSKAMEMFQKSVDADKKKAFAARNNLAVMYREKYSEAAGKNVKDFETAEKQIQNVLAVDTSNKKAYENLARLYYDRGRLANSSYLLLANLVVTQAIAVLKEKDEESADLYNLSGLLRMQEDNQVEALRAFRKAVSVDEQHVDSNLNIAFISIRFRDYAQAEKSLAIALKDPVQKKNIEAVLAMGVAKRGLKKYDEARKHYEDAAKLDAKDPRPSYNLGILEHEHVSATKDDRAGQEAAFKVAKKHYEKFVSLAGSGKSWKPMVDDAKGRSVTIDDAIAAFRRAEEMQKKADELAALEKKQAEEERKRLLELEKKAMEAAEAAEAAGAAEPEAPAEGDG